MYTDNDNWDGSELKIQGKNTTTNGLYLIISDYPFKNDTNFLIAVKVHQFYHLHHLYHPIHLLNLVSMIKKK